MENQRREASSGWRNGDGDRQSIRRLPSSRRSEADGAGGGAGSRRPRPGEGFSTRRAHAVAYLVPTPQPPARALGACLDDLQRRWQRDNPLAALWQAWPSIAGPQLAPHCRPLSLRAGVLSVGAAPGPWLQALLYNRHQLLGALRGAGFAIRDLRLQQHHQPEPAAPGSELEESVWACHPSRIDVHGLAECPRCQSPAPAGEMARWGWCGFCQRSRSVASPVPAPDGERDAASAMPGGA